MHNYVHVYIRESRQKVSETAACNCDTSTRLIQEEEFVKDSFNVTYFDSEFWVDRVNNLRDSVMTGLTGEDIKDNNPNLISTIHSYFIDKPRPFGRKLSNSLFKTPQVDAVLEIIGEKVAY